MYLEKFIIIHLIHSSGPEPGGQYAETTCPMGYKARRKPIRVEAKVLSEKYDPLMPDCHRQGEDGSVRTMILLYGAGGGPGRGEKPMDSIRSRASDDFPLHI